MSHEWHRGVLTTSSWHGLEDIGVMADDREMIQAGERSGAWPIGVRFEECTTSSGLKVPGRALVANYAANAEGVQYPEAALSCVGGRFRATTPEEWRSLIHAAVAAGAKPTGAFSLRDGTRVLATFAVGPSDENKPRASAMFTQLVLADAFDGTMRLQGGFTTIQVVCANTLSAAMSQDGDAWAALRHTASLEVTVNALRAGIAAAIASGDKVRAAYERAEQSTLTPEQFEAVFDKLFPAAPEDGAKTRAENVRAALGGRGRDRARLRRFRLLG